MNTGLNDYTKAKNSHFYLLFLVFNKILLTLQNLFFINIH